MMLPPETVGPENGDDSLATKALSAAGNVGFEHKET
jgi:hypothetical protein